jgi:hypothetical protein
VECRKRSIGDHEVPLTRTARLRYGHVTGSWRVCSVPIPDHDGVGEILSSEQHFPEASALRAYRPPSGGITAVADSPAAVYELDPLQDPRWARLVERHPRASPFHTMPWLEALRQTYGYTPVVYTTSPPESDLRNGVVLCRVCSWITGRRLVSLPFSDHCEPLIDSPADMEDILGGLRAARESGKWKYVELRPKDPDIFGIEAEPPQPSRRYYLHTIDLDSSERELFGRFHKDSIQRRIRRAERAGLTHEYGSSEALLKKFYGLQMLTRRRHRMPPQPGRWFFNLRARMGDALEIHVASYKGRPAASVLTLRFKDTAVYKYGGSDQAFHALGSMPFVLWKAIQKAHATGARVFDLGRTELGNQGGIIFKDRWGSVRSSLAYWRLPATTQEFSLEEGPAFRLAQNFFSLLPDSMLRLTGELMYPHIG